LRVVVFAAGGPLARPVLDALAERATIGAVVVPALPPPASLAAVPSWLRRWKGRRAFAAAGHHVGAAVMSYRPSARAAIEARLRTLAPDLICVAAFPHLLPPSTLGCARHGALNLHPSLLPRHRGPSPLFWTYFHDDREAGVTAHWMDAGADTGPLIAQEAVVLARGRPLADLYAELAGQGAALLQRALGAIERGTAARVSQDEARATREPAPRRDTWRIDFGTWGAERLWHFLAGVAGWNAELLDAPDGARLIHGPALGFVLERHRRAPGSVERVDRIWRVFCRDGVVQVAGPRGLSRVRSALRARLRV
jgi:methionyl-tRNA formyltransferase